MLRGRTRLLAWGVAALAALPGCNPDIACSCTAALPFLTISVRDGLDGGLLPAALVSDVSCAPTGVCTFRTKPDGGPPGAGPVALEVTASGHRSESLTIDVPAVTPVQTAGCCGPGLTYVPQSKDVLLDPL